jgi:hypothetical protein
VYPNPTESEINITQSGNEQLQIKLMNITGKVLVKITTSEKTNTINIANYSDGIYLIEIQNERGVVTHKVIKN